MSGAASYRMRHAALFAGLGLTLAFVGLFFLRVGFLDAVELRLYDLRMRLLETKGQDENIILVNIDDASIRNLGRWPWSRSIIAQGLEKIAKGDPKAVGLNVFFGETEESGGLLVLDKLQQAFSRLGLLGQPGGSEFSREMATLRAGADHDAVLARSLSQAGNVVLPMIFTSAGLVDEDGAELDALLSRQALGAVRTAKGGSCPGAVEAMLPIPSLFEAAAGLGHINMLPDADGSVRSEALLFKYRGAYFPSYSLRVLAQAMGLSSKDIRADLGASVSLANLGIPTTPGSDFFIRFRGPHGAFPGVSFFDVLHDKIPPSAFKGKIVLVAPTAAGVANPVATPVDPAMPLGELTANAVWSMENGLFIVRPMWNDAAQLLALLLAGGAISFLLPRLRARAAAALFLLLLAVLFGGSTYLFVARGMWVEAAYPLVLTVFGYITIISLKYFMAETDKDQVEGESAETNRMLGLSFQSQGMLDMAFDKFRRVPVDEGMKEILYNLALDYERKRQFNKAVAAYDHIERNDPAFKDVAERKKRMLKLGDTIILGGSSGGDSLLAGGADTHPTLGRYELLGELGRGAMGVVYKGRDPRINRTTAIKTFRFTEGLEPEEAAKFKEMFFREAESAGTLNHPNIVTIYDAGEEQDLAYIAMEYLEGKSLQALISQKALPPLRIILRRLADAARALDYAHLKGIVHRDIKPANLMVSVAGEIKITDFGIARITASSNTQTGVVKGTPQFMSPEQIAGRKVDGRSDIFSLGVVLYQILTGRLPFTGDNVTTLMHRIINEPHPDPKTLNPGIMKALVQVIDKALQKDPDKRYQRAGQMAAHLDKIAAWLDARAAATPSRQGQGGAHAGS